MNPQHLQSDNHGEIVRTYFQAGLSYNEILEFLRSYHNINITVRQLHRILRKEALFRRKHKSSINDVIEAIQSLLKGPSSNHGYRSIHLKLRNMGLTIDRETVRLCLRSLDPEGVQLRISRRLQRRSYLCPGPNYLWHIDGYDKLKPYGFPIHGAIDGYSRRILWLKVASSNNNPKFIASYFLETVENLSLIPRCIRADRGSENTTIAGIQRYFRRNVNDSSCGQRSFLFGPSTSNQRIEAWWSIFKRNRCIWWINFFKDFCNEGLDVSLNHHLECLRFCFVGLLQTELDETLKLWNNHYIRSVKNSESPAGRPNVLFFTPQLSQGRDCKYPLSSSDLEASREFVTSVCMYDQNSRVSQHG